MSSNFVVILPAAGLGKRMGHGIPKAFIKLDNKSILFHTVSCFLPFQEVTKIIVALPKELINDKKTRTSLPADNRIMFVEGGEERLHSINNALKLVENEAYVAVHDAVRPFVTNEDIQRVFDAAKLHDSAILAIPSANTLKQVDEDGCVAETLNREQIWQALTPQVFKTEIIRDAYSRAYQENRFGTDDASLVEAAGYKVTLVHGDSGNIKLTFPSDLKQAEKKIAQTKPMYRIGTGFDIHQLAEGRKLILGGVDVPFEKGLLGHSDADILIHAVIDAITGALSLGDIGSHFPDTDQKFKDIDSRILLRRAYELMENEGYEIVNVDSTIVAQRPKLRTYIDLMRQNLASDLRTDVKNISVKATTSEKIGFVGREEGMSASAVVLLSSNQHQK